MDCIDPSAQAGLAAEPALDGSELLRELVAGESSQPRPAQRIGGVVIGELLALAEGGSRVLVAYPGQPGSAALDARTTVDLHAAHIGREVTLMFEAADPSRPIVTGVLRGEPGWPLAAAPGEVEVEGDGERLIVSAREQLVLRCGQASITLTRSGRVTIAGTQVSSTATGVNRLRGGFVHLN